MNYNMLSTLEISFNFQIAVTKTFAVIVSFRDVKDVFHKKRMIEATVNF